MSHRPESSADLSSPLPSSVMVRAMRKLYAVVVPVRWRRWRRARFGWRWLRGDFANWAEARAEAERDGTADGNIARVVAAARAVRAGRAAWERDGICFAQAEVHAPLLAALRRAAASDGGRLTLVDFGGALGSTWWQHRAELTGLEVDWRVVEVPALVEAGRREFAGEGLSFHDSLEAADRDGQVTAILFSSVLAYLENPWAMLAAVARRRCMHVIVDRTGFVPGGRGRLAVQSTPPELGGGRMPCWLFERERLEAALAGEYEPVDEWPVPFDVLDGSATYRGVHFVRQGGGPGQ